MTDHTSEPWGSPKVSYLTESGHLMLVFRRGEEVIDTVRVLGNHEAALGAFHDPFTNTGHSVRRRLDSIGIAHDLRTPDAA